MLFDTHAHYDARRFDSDRHELLASMEQNGVGRILNAGCDLESSRAAIELAHQYDFLYAAVGSHPDDADHVDGALVDTYRELAKEEKVVAIGEIGLDYYWDKENHETQKYWFRRQMDLAKELELPIIVHSREACADTLEEIKKAHTPKLKGVIHCFSYAPETAREYLEMGYYIGVGGVVTFKNAKKLKEVVKMLPPERILLETDCPYLAPVPNRGKRNSSLNLPYVAEAVAELKGMETEEVIRITNENARKLYFQGREL